jgi:hypothetical protein
MPAKLRESRRREIRLAMAQEMELLTGSSLPTIESRHHFRSAFDSERERRAAWHARKGDITAFAERCPLGRPWGWWRYESADSEREALLDSADDYCRTWARYLREAQARTTFVGTSAPRMF